MRFLKSILFASVFAVPVAGHGQGTTVVHGISELSAPGGGTFSTFQIPALGQNGDAGFLADLTATSGGMNDDNGLFIYHSEELLSVVREGDNEVGGSGVFKQFTTNAVRVNAAGQLSFQATVGDPMDAEDENDGIFLWSDDELDQIARVGMPAPDGMATNGIFAHFFGGSALNSAGDVAFQAFMSNTDNDSGDNSGLFLHDGTSIVELVRKGDMAPDGDGTFGSLADTPALNDSGATAFAHNLVGTAGGSEVDGRIFLHDGSQIVELLREGDAVPGGDGSFGGGIAPFSGMVLNENNTVAFAGQLTGTGSGAADDSGVFRTDGTTTAEIAREGAPPPNMNGELNGFAKVTLNDDGQVAFTATLRNTSGGAIDNQGLYRGDGETLEVIARKSQAAPTEGFPDGTFSNFTSIAINEMGQVAFDAQLMGTSDGSLNDRGIFMFDDELGLLQVVRKGDVVENSSITGLGFAGSSAPGGETASGFNDQGQVAFRFELDDGRQGFGIYSLDPPLEVLGDYNGDGTVNAADYVVWRNALGDEVEIGTGADGDESGEIDQGDYDVWKMQFGTTAASGALSMQVVPEPAATVLVMWGAFLSLTCGRHRPGAC